MSDETEDTKPGKAAPVSADSKADKPKADGEKPKADKPKADKPKAEKATADGDRPHKLRVGDTDPETGLVVEKELVDEVDSQGHKTGRKVHSLSGVKRLTWRDFKTLDPWKRRITRRWIAAFMAIGIIFLAVACVNIYSAVDEEQSSWWHPGSRQEEVDVARDIADSNDATHVMVGTYLETIHSIDLKDSKFNVTLVAWFKWTGDEDLDMVHNINVYKGSIDSTDVLEDYVDGNLHYQLARINVTVSKTFNTMRFPLASNQMNVYIESEYPAEQVIFDGDVDNSAMNSSMSIAGFKVTSVEWGEAAHQYVSNFSQPGLSENPVESEYVTSIIVKRDGIGLYLKCFLAMYGTSLWVLIMIYICANHHVDTVGMIPGALFGTVSNIMVGAALVPDALSMGLLEYANIWGIMTILMGAMAIIQTNQIRSEHGRADERFARFFGHAMFWTVTILAVGGNILLPLFSWFC